MKTQKKNSFRGSVTSSILAFVLAFGLVPSGALAYASEAIPQIASENSETENATGDTTPAVQSENSAAVENGMQSSDDVREQGIGTDENAGADSASDADSNGSVSGTPSDELEDTTEGTQPLSPIYNPAADGVISAQMPLSTNGDVLTVGNMEIAGLIYTINADDPTTVSATGAATNKPEGSVAIQSQIASGGVTYKVTGIGTPANTEGAQVATASVVSEAPTGVDAGTADTAATLAVNPYITDAFTDDAKAPAVESVSIPASIQAIDPAFFQLFPNATWFEVAADNSNFSSANGMLFNADQTNLISVPEGMKGAAALPDTIATVPAYVFSRCTKLPAITVLGGAANTAFASENGILYTADKTTLVAAPAALGATATIAAQCTTISEGAFWATTNLQTIVTKGNVANIYVGGDGPSVISTEANTSAFPASSRPSEASGEIFSQNPSLTLPAFNPETTANATVASARIDENNTWQEAWRNAGFVNFSELAEPGTEVVQDGMVFTLLDDYTLSVRWENNEQAAPEELTIPAQVQVGDLTADVTVVANSGFAGQASIKRINLPETLTAIQAAGLQGTGLEELILPANTELLGDAALANCGALAAITLNDGLRIIGESTFAESGLSEVILPASVMSVGDYAFANSPNLQKIICVGTVAQVGASAIAGCNGVHILVPYNESETYAWNTGLPTAGNHIEPYGVKIAEESYELTAGDIVNLFEGDGYLMAPDGVETSFAYKASPMKIDNDGTVTAIQKGSTPIAVTLSLDEDDTLEAEGDNTVVNGAVNLTSAAPRTLMQATSSANIAANQEIMTAAVEDKEDGIAALASVQPSELFTFTKISDDACSVSAKNAATIAGDIVIPSTGVCEDGVTRKVTQTKAYGFKSASKITSVSIPATIEVIANDTFVYCSGIKNVTISSGNNTLLIAGHSFNGTTSLEEIFFPENVSYIESTAFTNSGVRKFEVDVRNTAYRTIDDVIYTADGKRLVLYPPQKNDGAVLNVPGTVNIISTYAFNGNNSLKTIYIPDSVSLIQRGAFVGCAIKDYYVYGDPTLQVATGYTPWWNTNNNTPPAQQPEETRIIKNIYCISEVVKVKFDALPEAKFTVPEVVTEVLNSNSKLVFETNSDGTCVVKAKDNSISGNVVIPSTYTTGGTTYTVTTIKHHGFQSCRSMISVSIPSTVTLIANDAFLYCSGLTNVVIGSGIDNTLRIKGHAFNGTTGLSEFSFPGRVIEVQSTSFVDSGICHYEVDSANNTYSAIDGVLYSKDSGTLILYPPKKTNATYSVPSTVHIISTYAFNGNSSLETIYIPDSVTDIYFGAFVGCRINTYYLFGNPNLNLVSTSTPWWHTDTGAPVTQQPEEKRIIKTLYCVSEEAKTKWEALPEASLPIPELEVQLINSDARLVFETSTDGTCSVKARENTISGAVVIPSTYTVGNRTYTVTSVKSRGFSGCTAMTSVSIPSTVNVIGNDAFYRCTNLQNVSIGGNSTESLIIGSHAFNSCTAMEEFFIPLRTASVSSTTFILSGIKKFSVDPNSTNFQVINDVLYSGDGGTLIMYPTKKEGATFNIPGTVHTLSTYAFNGNQNLETVYIPDSVTMIQKGTFNACNITTIYCYGSPTLEGNTSQYGIKCDHDPFWPHVPGSSDDLAKVTVYCPSSVAGVWRDTPQAKASPAQLEVVEILNAYSVTFHVYGTDNGSISVEGIPSTQLVGNNASIIRPADPTRKGYNFLGWYEKTASGVSNTQYNFSQAVTANHELYAKWEIINYKISYTSEKGALTSNPNPATYTVEQEITLGDPTLNYYTFTGWTNAASEQTVTPEKRIKIEKGTTGDIAFKAHFTAIAYTIQFNANAPAAENIANPSTISNLTVETTPKAKYPTFGDSARVGHTLNKWTIGTSTYSPGSEINLNALLDSNKASITGTTITLTASWSEKIYSIKFQATDNGATTATQLDNVSYTAAVSALPSQDKAILIGRYLNGWAINSAQSAKSYTLNTKPTPQTMIADGANITNEGGKRMITLYTKWAWSNYTIKYNNNSSAATGDTDKVESAPVATTFTYQNVTATQDSNKKKLASMNGTLGYTLSGWQSGSNSFGTGAIVDSDMFAKLFGAATSGNAEVTISAIWTPKKFEFKWNNGLEGASVAEKTWSGAPATNYNEKLTLPAASDLGYTNSGYDFSSWATAKSGGTDITVDTDNKAYIYDIVKAFGSTVTSNSAPLVLFAQWSAGDATSTIEYYLQESDGSYSVATEKGSISGKTGTSVNLLDAAYSSKAPATKDFGSHSYKRISNSGEVLSAILNRDSSPTFKVYYDLQLKVKLDSGDKSSGVAQEFTGLDLNSTLDGKAINEFVPDESKAYEFDYWKNETDLSDTKQYTTAELKAFVIKDNATFKAQWKPIEYELTYAEDNEQRITKLPVSDSNNNTFVYTYMDFYDEANGWQQKDTLKLADRGTDAAQADCEFGYYLNGWLLNGTGNATFDADFTTLFNNGMSKTATLIGVVGLNKYNFKFYKYSGGTDGADQVSELNDITFDALNSTVAFPSNVDVVDKLYGYGVSDWRSSISGVEEAFTAGMKILDSATMKSVIQKLNAGKDISQTATDHSGTFNLYAGWTLQYMVAVPLTSGDSDSQNSSTLKVDTGVRTAQTTSDVKVESFTARDVVLGAQSTMTSDMKKLALKQFFDDNSADAESSLSKIKFIYDGKEFSIDGTGGITQLSSTVGAAHKNSDGTISVQEISGPMLLNIDSTLTDGLASTDKDLNDKVWECLQKAIVDEINNNGVSGEAKLWGDIAKIVWTVSLADGNNAGFNSSTGEYDNNYTYTFNSSSDTTGTLKN